jgi:hypothetical protein
MTDSIEHRLQSSDPEDVYDAIIDIGKQGRGELAGLVVPYLTSPRGFLRDAALRTLTFYLGLAEHKATALQALDRDADPDVREAAAMGLGRFAGQDRGVLARLLQVAVNRDEEDTVRAAAFLAALVAAGIERAEYPRDAVIPGFERKANWALLALALSRAGIAVPPEVAALLPATEPDTESLHAMCEALCRYPGNDAAELAAALGLPGPVVDETRDVAALASPPAYARRIDLSRRKGTISHLTIELTSTGLSLGALDRRFGPGVRRPMDADGTYVFGYDVRVAGAPWECAMFASIGDVAVPPHAASVITELTLRRDRAS